VAKIQDYRRKWMQNINRMLHNRLPRIIKKQQTKRQKEPGETTEKTSGYVRPKQVKKGPNSIITKR